ncbi:hypothetical protein lerEdw1_008620 [Lerista edwardsae]|nr:hypothetical protein lerEdw1_008620 [Lerista edwardsae]
MSQAEREALSLLIEVEGWDSELCRRQLSTALPRLLSVYQISDTWSQHICILKILTEKFLPYINLPELEQAFFSKMLPKTIQLFDHLMLEISNQTKSLTSWNVDLHLTLRNHLQAVVQVLETLSGCVRHICTKDTVPLEYIHSVPSSVLHVIKNTFIYCKDCESLYSDCLHLFSDLLQSLFKEAYVLQKQFMELVDTVSVDSGAPEDSLSIMVSVMHTILEISSVISSIDQALHANIWKFIIRQSLKHKWLIKDNLKHSDILRCLCEDILFSFQSSLQLAEQMKNSGTQESIDYKLFQRTIKLCRFFAISLVRYTKEFTPFLVDSCSLLHQTYLQIYSLYAPVILEAHQNEIVSGFLVAFDTFIHQLLSFKPFLDVVLNKRLDLSPELHFPQCRLLLSVMDTLPSQPPDVQSLWNAGSQFPEEIPRVPLLVALFLSLQQCSGELSLPVSLADVTGPGQAEGPVTLYQYVCIHLCTFITSLSVSHFFLLECFLLETVLGSNMITALLAMDAWCFLARYGTADLCAHYAFIIANLVEFTQKFLPKETNNLLLWQHLSLKALEPLLRKQVAHDLFVTGLAQCQEWLSNERPLEELSQVNLCLSAWLSMCQTAGETLEEGQQTALIGAVGQLLTVLHATQAQRHVDMEQDDEGCKAGFWSSLSAANLLPDVSTSATLHPKVTASTSNSGKKLCDSEACLAYTDGCLANSFSVEIASVDQKQEDGEEERSTGLTSPVLLRARGPVGCMCLCACALLALGTLPEPADSAGRCQPLEHNGRCFHLQSGLKVQILSKMSCLFASLLACSNWLIHQHALEAFTQFAEETSHEDILPQCFNTEEIKSKVVCFLSKTQQVEEVEEARVDRLKKENALLRCHLQKTMAEGQRALVLEPSPKRSCYSHSEVHYKSAIDTVEGTLETVKLLLQQGPPPIWLAKKLEALQATLSSLKNSIH